MASRRICSIEECSNPHAARGLCLRHYSAWRRNGGITDGMATPHGEAQRFFNDVVLHHATDECLIWPYNKNSNGYPRIRINGKLEYVTRLACKRLNGPPPSEAHHAAHLCGRGHEGCCAPAHLRWASPSENNCDKFEHGTDNRGERHYSTSLMASDVLEIRRLQGLKTQQELADCYGISRVSIADIHARRTWRHI